METSSCNVLGLLLPHSELTLGVRFWPKPTRHTRPGSSDRAISAAAGPLVVWS